MQYGKALTIGAIGALAMTVVTATARMVGMPVNIEMTLGMMVNHEPGVGTWGLGFFMHMIMGAVFALGYAAVFEYGLHRSGVGLGAIMGFAHGMLIGIMLGAIPALQPVVPGVMPDPGVFMLNLGGAGVVLLFATHIMFGAIVGGIYAVKHRPPVPRLA